MKRFLSMLLITVLVTGWVAVTNPRLIRPTEPEKRYALFCSILSTLENHHQIIDCKNGVWTLTSSPIDGRNHITPAERRFLIDQFMPYLNVPPVKTRAEAYAELREVFQTQPEVTTAYVDLGNSRFLQGTLDFWRAVKEAERTATQGRIFTFLSAQRQPIRYEIQEQCRLYRLSLYVRTEVVSTDESLRMEHVSGAQACSGILSIVGAQTTSDTPPVTRPDDWAEARNETVFQIRPCIGPYLQEALYPALELRGSWTHCVTLRAFRNTPYGSVQEELSIYPFLDIVDP